MVRLLAHQAGLCDAEVTRPAVSLVDGYNLPMRITNNVGCPVPDCPVDLGPNCEYSERISSAGDSYHSTSSIGPAALKGPFDSSGFPVGCKSACSAGLGDPGKFFIHPL